MSSSEGGVCALAGTASDSARTAKAHERSRMRTSDELMTVLAHLVIGVNDRIVEFGHFAERRHLERADEPGCLTWLAARVGDLEERLRKQERGTSRVRACNYALELRREALEAC